MEPINDKQKKQWVLNLISDSVMDLLYYDRKECEIFEHGDIEKLVERKVITIDEMVDEFRNCLEK